MGKHTMDGEVTKVDRRADDIGLRAAARALAALNR
jgi:hypothetical protein